VYLKNKYHMTALGGHMAEDDGDIDLEKARLDPGSVFVSPEKLCESSRLSKEEKVELLQRWAEDARELEIADDEGMSGGELSLLDRVLTSLESLGGSFDTG
jgi:hypothetical protein